MLSRSSLLTIAAALAVATAASAQVGTFYTFAQSVGTYTPITGGTVLGTSSTTNILDDTTFPAVTLPFSFPFDSTAQTQVSIQTNGHLAFGTSNPTSYAPLSSTTVAPGFVSAFGRDLMGGYAFAGSRTLGSDQLTGVSSIGPLQVGDAILGAGIPTGTTILAIVGNTITMSALATATSTGTFAYAYGPWSEVRYEVVGSSPNQEFVVQWSNFRRFTTSTLTTAQDMILNFQIRLREDGRIQCVYGNCTPGATTLTTVNQVGLRGPTNAFPANVNNRLNAKGVSDWATSTAGTLNTSGEVFNNAAPANVIPTGLTYEWAPPAGVVATNTTVGQGCGAVSNSFYQLFANATAASTALSGNSLLLTPNGSAGYNGTWLPGSAASLYVTPVTPTALATGDDGTSTFTLTSPFPTPQGPQSSLLVSGNAIVAWGGATIDFPGTNSFTPTAGGFLNSTLGGVYSWHDYNSAEVGSGPVQSEEIGNVAYVTFNGVENYANPEVLNPSTMQFQLDKTTGNITIVWLNIDGNASSTFGSTHLIGVSSPGASINTGSVNLATATLSSVNPEVQPLALTASNRPIQGAGPTTWDLVTSNIPLTTVIGLDIFGLSDPNIPDLGLFGLAKSGCQLHANLDVLNAWFSTGATHNYSFAIPPSPSLNNFILYTQSVCLGNGLMTDNITSNAIQGKIGNL